MTVIKDDNLPPSKLCRHCGKPIPPGPKQKWCSRECRKAAGKYRAYHKRKLTDPEGFAEWRLKYRVIAKRWREKQAASGNCSRCGKLNDRAESGFKLCSLCLDGLKGRENNQPWRWD